MILLAGCRPQATPKVPLHRFTRPNRIRRNVETEVRRSRSMDGARTGVPCHGLLGSAGSESPGRYTAGRYKHRPPKSLPNPLSHAYCCQRSCQNLAEIKCDTASSSWTAPDRRSPPLRARPDGLVRALQPGPTSSWLGPPDSDRAVRPGDRDARTSDVPRRARRIAARVFGGAAIGVGLIGG